MGCFPGNQKNLVHDIPFIPSKPWPLEQNRKWSTPTFDYLLPYKVSLPLL